MLQNHTFPNKAALTLAFDTMFKGRLFAVGNPYTNAVWGKVGTYSEASNDLDRDIQCGNGGNGCDILEVSADGVPIKKAIQ